MKTQITVFTPTYNREKLLARAYNSLKNQTCKDFIWLVIDDGSTDDTKSVIKDFINDADFTIKYIYQENSGKQKSRNKAVLNCTTEYFITLDSDDILDEHAIEIMYKRVDQINDNANVCGLIAPKYRMDNHEPSYGFMPNVKYCNSIDLYKKYKYRGETTILFKTEILKKYPNPEIDGERFVPESISYNEIAKSYDLLITNDKLYYFEYQEDGYSTNIYKYYKENPNGYALYLKSECISGYSIKERIINNLLYIIWCKLNSIRGYNTASNKVLYILLYPFAMICKLFKLPRSYFN